MKKQRVLYDFCMHDTFNGGVFDDSLQFRKGCHDFS